MPYIGLKRKPWEEPLGCRRITGRVPVEAIESTVGPVLNLSSHGARVSPEQKLKVGDELTVRIGTEDVRVEVAAKVIWVKRIGFFRSEAGLQFTTDISEQARRVLTRLCTVGRDRLTLAHDHLHPQAD